MIEDFDGLSKKNWGSRGLTPIPEGEVLFDVQIERLKMKGPKITETLKRFVKVKKERRRLSQRKGFSETSQENQV